MNDLLLKSIVVLSCLVWLMDCTDESQPQAEDTGVDSAEVGDTATGEEVDQPGGEDPALDQPVADSEDDVPEVDSGPDLPYEIPTLSPIAERPTESALPSAIESCPVFREEICVEGRLSRCEVYDSGAEGWADALPRMTEQALVFDRYYDLYHEFEGMAVDIDFTRPMPAGTPESEWSSPEAFSRMDAFGDASGWTGTALLSASARFGATGTDADYERMLARFEWMMFMYEVTGIPGMIARSHFALLPEGAPRPVGNWGRAICEWYPDDGSGWHYHYPIEGDLLDRVPDYYTDGVTIGETHYDTQPRWMGDASRDMYVRSLPGVMMAYDFLGEGAREDALRAVVERELPCTLNRLRYGRIINLQEAPELIEAVTAFLGSQTYNADEGDLDFETLDTIIFFAMDQPNPAHWDRFERECSDGPPTEIDPSLELDAADPLFLLKALDLFSRMDRSESEPIAWIMAPSVRASDLMFLMQWALVAHYLTDDERYLDYIEMLMTETEFEGVLLTHGSLRLPKWCSPHFGPSLTYPTLYNLLARISADAYPDTWSLLSRVATEEARYKEMDGVEDAFFGILYNRMWDPEQDPTGAEYVAHFVELLGTYGMVPDNHLEPDRNYSRNWVEPPHPDIEIEEPSEEVRAICEDSVEVFGTEIPGPGLADENPRAVDALPLSMRIGGGLNWTQDPWIVLREYGSETTTQWPMLGMTTPYWVGRADGVITEGQGFALGWHVTEEVCGD